MVDSNIYRVNTIQHLLAAENGLGLGLGVGLGLGLGLCYVGLNGRCKICHCLQGGALATTNMIGHGGKSSLSTCADLLGFLGFC